MNSKLTISGLGLRIADIRELLDARLVLQALGKLCPYMLSSMKGPGRKYSEYQNTDNAGKLRMLERFLDEQYRGLAGLLLQEDHLHLLRICVEPRSRDVSILYPPRFPWRMREQEQTSEQDAIRYISGVVAVFLLPGISPDILQDRIHYYGIRYE